ncbi:MAG: ABC transporter permease [Chloroflexi bacterium]|nr:ABC transporter permease [Chloroflexota bacterium]
MLDFPANSAVDSIERPTMDPVKIYDSDLRPPPMIEELRGLVRYKDLVGQLISKGIKTRYKRSVLGVAWTMLHPLLTMTVLTLVFSRIFRFSNSDYALYVLSGLIAWSFFAQSTTAAAGDLLWSGGLISKVLVPKSVFAVSAVGTALINLLLALLVYALIAVALGRPIQPTVLLLPLPVVLLGLFSLGVGLAVSAAAVYFPDVLPTYEILLMAWMYLTPVIYPAELLPESVQNLLRFNPLFHLIQPFRAILVEGRTPSVESLLVSSSFALSSLLVGWWLFTRKARDFAYRL